MTPPQKYTSRQIQIPLLNCCIDAEHLTNTMSHWYTVTGQYSCYCWCYSLSCNNPLTQCCTMPNVLHYSVSAQYTHCMMSRRRQHCMSRPRNLYRSGQIQYTQALLAMPLLSLTHPTQSCWLRFVSIHLHCNYHQRSWSGYIALPPSNLCHCYVSNQMSGQGTHCMTSPFRQLTTPHHCTEYMLQPLYYCH